VGAGSEVAAPTRPVSGPELTSPILDVMADGVKGGVSRRSESVVVCDFSSVVHAFTRSRRPGASVVPAVEGVAGAVGASDDWKCARRVWVVLQRSASAARSVGFAMVGRLWGKLFFIFSSAAVRSSKCCVYDGDFCLAGVGLGPGSIRTRRILCICERLDAIAPWRCFHRSCSLTVLHHLMTSQCRSGCLLSQLLPVIGFP